jgi:hypothetical protein
MEQTQKGNIHQLNKDRTIATFFNSHNANSLSIALYKRPR